MSLERWDRASAEEIDEYGIFRIRRYLARSPRTGQNRPFTVIDTFEWVNVVALTPRDEVVLVNQFRHGTQEFSLEVPGGVVHPGEDPGLAAVRELREETGYEGSEVSFLGTIEPNPAILSNHCHLYLAKDCEKVGEPDPDPGEDLEVVMLPRAEVAAAIADGRIAHALVIGAFWFLQERESRDA